MKKIFNRMAMLVAATSLVLMSCSEEDKYVPAEPVTGMQVMISPEAAQKVSLTIDQTTFTIPFTRVDSTKAAKIALKVEKTDEDIYTVPSEVVFEAGKKCAEIVVDIDASKLQYGKMDSITVTIAQESTPYGIASKTFIVGPELTWSMLGKCTYIDEYYFGDKTEVVIYQNDQDPALYRLPNPYINILKAGGEDVSADATEWMFVRILKKGETCIGQVVPEDGMVYFYGDGTAKSVNTGYHHPNYDDDLCLVFPGAFTSMSDPAKWVYNKVVEYMEDGTAGAVQLAPYYYLFSVGGWNATQENGAITIYFPGCEPKDYELSVKFEGRMIDTKENGSAVFSITMGADVASAKYLMTDGKDPMEAYAAILEGAEGVEEITASGEVKIAYETPGDKTIVVVGFDAEGNEVNAVYSTINIPAGGEPTETWTAIYVGDYFHCVESYAENDEPLWDVSYPDAINSGSTLYISDQGEERYKIKPWIDGEFVFTMGEEGITFVNQNSGVYSDRYKVYIGATDLYTAGLFQENKSMFKEGVFYFDLLWHDVDGDITDEYTWWNYTRDAFQLTGEVDAPSNLKACAPKAHKLNVKKNLAFKLEKDVRKSPATKFAYKNFKKQTFAK